jgi:hypothetical protein
MDPHEHDRQFIRGVRYVATRQLQNLLFYCESDWKREVMQRELLRRQLAPESTDNV